MANMEQLVMLRQGVYVWNNWRREHSQTEEVDLSGADLWEANLSGADLSGADLSRANLSGADLSRADLREAYLSGANLREANLREANLSRADLRETDLSGAYLSEADLFGANLFGANLREANLSEADLSKAYLSKANLSKANLSGADLSRADLRETDLSGADLSGAYLSEVYLSETIDSNGVEPTERPAIEVEIAIPQEKINDTDLKELRMAIDNLMEVCGFELAREFDPIRGSWWQTLIFWSRNQTTQTVVNRTFQTLKEVFVARSIGIPSAEETIKLTEAVDRVVKMLEPFESAAIRLGKLLVIKGNLGGKPALRVETISLSLAQKLAENPQLINMPESLLRLIEEEKIVNQAPSHLVPLDKPQGNLSPE
jgi:uncharacterized protein YjbI with pentapeptide repeats